MPKRNYKLRINVRPLEGDRLYAYVTMSDEVAAMFDKPYVSVKRMQDRLAFCQWDNKTGNGMVTVGRNTLQFGVQSDCEKMQDFCGQYNLVNKTDSGTVFVKLCDRKPFDVVRDGHKGVAHAKVSDAAVDDLLPEPGEEPPIIGIPALRQFLGEQIEKLQDEFNEIKSEIDRITNECSRKVQPLHAQKNKINEQIVAYCKAYNYMKESE